MLARSKALVKFAKTQSRCLGLVRLWLAIDKNQEIRKFPHNDILRAAIVLSVSSMDAYFTDRFSELIIPAIRAKNVGNNLIELIEKAGLDTHRSIELLTMERPYRRIRTLVEKHVSKKVTQRFDAIDEMFSCLGLSNFCRNIEASLGRKQLLRSIEILIERRHSIVHDGDYNKHGNLRRLNSYRIVSRIRYISIFIEGAEEFLKNSLG